MNIYYYKVTGLDIPLFWKNILKMAIVPGIMMFSGLLINRIYEIDNWIIFLIGIIVFTGIYIVLMYEVSFNEYERSIFREPLKRIIKTRTSSRPQNATIWNRNISCHYIKYCNNHVYDGSKLMLILSSNNR